MIILIREPCLAFICNIAVDKPLPKNKKAHLFHHVSTVVFPKTSLHGHYIRVSMGTLKSKHVQKNNSQMMMSWSLQSQFN